MNVLLVNGSPRRRGNTAAALAALQRGLMSRHLVETVNVLDFKLVGCVNCDGCKRNGGTCVQPDDGAKFMNKVTAADLVVFGTPVYWWGISGQLKLALDKFYSKDELFHRTPKLLGVVAVGAADTGDPEYRLISGQFRCIADYLGWKIVLDEAIAASAAGEVAANAALLAKLESLAAKIS